MSNGCERSRTSEASFHYEESIVLIPKMEKFRAVQILAASTTTTSDTWRGKLQSEDVCERNFKSALLDLPLRSNPKKAGWRSANVFCSSRIPLGCSAYQP